MKQIQQLLSKHHLLTHQHMGITTLTIRQPDGFEVAKEILETVITQQTLLLLSGGRTPKELYTSLAQDERIIPGAVGLIDERYGEPMHESSNEKMIAETGFTRYLQMRDIPYYPILSSRRDSSHNAQNDFYRAELALMYDATLRDLFQLYRHSLGILGIGLDGHTAGLPADPLVWKEYDLKKRDKTEYVVEYDDHGKFYNQRISMTFLSLSLLDTLLVLCFGNDKRHALQLMLQEGSEEEVPSRFFKRPDIAKKTLLITDQEL